MKNCSFRVTIVNFCLEWKTHASRDAISHCFCLFLQEANEAGERRQKLPFLLNFC